MFGDESRWVEILPFAVMEQNQKTNSLLEHRFTPFEASTEAEPKIHLLICTENVQ